MATSDIFNLDKSIAPRLIRILYVLALILIALGVIFGVGRGIAIMAAHPGPRAVAAAPAADRAAPAPNNAQTAAPAAQAGRVANRPSRFARRGFRGRRGIRGRGAYAMARRAPVLFGTLMIVRALVMGAIALMVVRILAELANAILRMPQRE